MNFLSLFFIHYFVLIIALTIFYFIGHFLFFFLRDYFSINGNYLNYFSKTFTGLISFVTFYSIIIAHFRTVNLCFLLIFALMFYELSKHFPPTPSLIKNEKKFKPVIIFEFVIVSFFLCGWEALFLLSDNAFPFVTPHFDHTDYSSLSQFLNLTGQENAFRESNFYNDVFKGLIPYHYFELWLNAAVAKCSGLLYSSSLLLIVYPVFYFLFYLGIIALWEEFGEVAFYKKLYSLLFLFFGAFCFPFYEKLPFVNNYFWGLMIKSYPIEFLAKKMICNYVFIIPAFLCIRRKYFSLGFLFLLCLSVIFAATSPGILAGSLFFIVLAYFLNLIPFIELRKIFAYQLIFTFFIFSIYRIFGNTTFITYEGNIFDFISTENSELKKQLADVIWLCQTIPVQVLLAYSPFILIISFLCSCKKSKNEISDFRTIILLITVIIFTGAITWAFLLPVTDSFQFYSSLITLLHIGCIFILIKMLSSADFTNAMSHGKKVLVYFLLTAALTAQVVFSFQEQWERKRKNEYIYSSGYILEIEKVKNEIKNPVGACLYAKDTPMLAPYRIQVGLYLKFIPGFENLVNISVLDKEYVNLQERHHLKSSFFYFYAMKQKSNGKFQSIERSQLDFINEFKIDYIVAQKNSVISAAILQREKKVITDSHSQEKFILLH